MGHGLNIRCWQSLKAAYIVHLQSALKFRNPGDAQSGNKILSFFFFLENLMKFYNANYMKIAWWFGQCSDHSRHTQMILVFGKTVEDCVRVKKKC